MPKPELKAANLTWQHKEHHQLRVIQDTQRRLVTTADQRSSIEEALVSLETSCSGGSIDLERLDGTWRLQYTSAPDVLVLLDSAARFPFFQEGNGATLVVSAKFSVVSARNIYLQFDQIRLQDIYINEGLQALIVPALLPRSFLSLQVLQFIRSFRAEIPVQDRGSEMLLGRAVGGGGCFVFSRGQPLQLLAQRFR
ncbi:hypothetical protein MLD38_018219 [Melastoma candidum]|uniref:Uncharacterized protein n=1 Tax=Melastoma candidum TaxID=119954 RepID=A0ACB9QTN7_9MYRT|nr:hypothetical protein MLD38_018219 [Melastoma candidum]